MQNAASNSYNAAAMNGYSSIYPPPASTSAPYAPAVSRSGPPQLQDPELLPSNARYGTNGTTRQTPPSDALLNGYANKLNYNGAVQGHARTTSHLLDVNDPVSIHLLVETALGDSATYDVLSFDEVERLKKELAALNPRIESVRKRLALESKVRDAALSLNRLYRKSSESPQSKRRGSHGTAGRRERDSIDKTEAELATANKKCADLSRELYSLEVRQQKCQSKLLMHTAGVLQMTHKGPTAKRHLNEFENVPQGMVKGVNSGRPNSPDSIYTYENGRLEHHRARGARDDFDERSLYKTPDEMYAFPFDGSSNTERSMQMQKSFTTLGRRLEDLNSRLKSAIAEVNNGSEMVSPLDAPQAGDAATLDSVTRQIETIEQNITTFRANTFSLTQSNRQLEYSLQQSQRQMADALAEKDSQYEDVLAQRNADIERLRARAQDVSLRLEEAQQRSAKKLDAGILGKIEYSNKQLYALLKAAAGFRKQEMPPPPPSLDESDPEAEAEYTVQAMEALSGMYQELMAFAEEARGDKAEREQMETVLQGLWSIILADEEDERRRLVKAGGMDDGLFDSNEKFSLQAFSTKVQWLVGLTTDLREQLVTRDGQHDASKADLLQQLANAEKAKSEEIAKMNALREEKEREFTVQMDTARGDSKRVVELEERLQAQSIELQGIKDALEVSRQTTTERQNTLQTLRQQLSVKDEQLSALNNAAPSSNDKDKKEIERLENELVRLTTDLTIAKAELDSAYGSRAQRKAETEGKLEEAQAQITSLQKQLEGSKGPTSREKELEDELRDTLKEFEELTKSSVEDEKQRDKLEAAMDGLREKVEAAEAALNDEKVKWLGVKNPAEGGEKGELTSMTTMRAEFKKMMRDTRLEGVKALRAEQDERKKLEQQLKQLKREQQGVKQSGLRQMFSAATGY